LIASYWVPLREKTVSDLLEGQKTLFSLIGKKLSAECTCNGPPPSRPPPSDTPTASTARPTRPGPSYTQTTAALSGPPKTVIQVITWKKVPYVLEVFGYSRKENSKRHTTFSETLWCPCDSNFKKEILKNTIENFNFRVFKINNFEAWGWICICICIIF
jgi:hypothetical protein